MHLAGVKRPPEPSILTDGRDVKRRNPLSQLPGNTVTPRPVAQTVVAQATQQHVISSRSPETIPLCSPNHITELWDTVRAKNSADMASRGASAETASNSMREDRTRGDKRASGSKAGGRVVSESAGGDTEDHTSSTTTAPRAMGPSHGRFRPLVLDPRGITLHDQKPKAKPPERHFDTRLPLNEGCAADPLLSHTSIWVLVDASRAEDISKHYSFMEKMRLSEDQFATYAKQIFFKCEEWELVLGNK